MEPCGILAEVSTTTTDGTTDLCEMLRQKIKALVSECKSWETNYQNLLAEYEKLSEIAQGQAKIIAKYQKAEIEMLEGKK